MLSDKIRVDLNTAMKARDSLRVLVLRMVLSELNYKKIEIQKELTDEDVVTVIQREVKKRREAVESYRAGGRVEQEEQEKKELAILQEYLPKQMGEKEIVTELVGMDLPKDFAAAMKVAGPKFRGKADGAVVAKLVRGMVNG